MSSVPAAVLVVFGATGDLARRKRRVTLKAVPHLAFAARGSIGVRPNQLVLEIQPDEGV